MGCSQGAPTEATDPKVGADGHSPANNEAKGKLGDSFFNMLRELGFACVLPVSRKDWKRGVENGIAKNPEHNQAWLLAESGGGGGGLASSDPQSVHSSFRFSLCSQVELESLNMAPASSSSATVLMVNLDNGLCESQSRELKWRRIATLERRISPVASHSLVRFSYGEIASATRNFSKARVLGRGALSCVFRARLGILRSAVAIKKLDKEDKECAKAFSRELMIASSLQNPNIVPLLGFCIDPEEGLFLVYRFVSGGSLERHLHEKRRGKRGGRCTLPWSARYKVAIGIAEAVAYLHNGTGKCVVHRDIKPSNILLSSNKTPKLCDFGLATWTSAPSVPFLCKTVKGTFGYLAPEYFQHGKVSDKTDIYAFGVVLLELLTGRKPIEAQRAPEENLVAWAEPHLQQGETGMKELLDPRIKLNAKDKAQAAKVIRAAAACINCEESQRPAIDEIITILRGEKAASSSQRKPGNEGADEFCPQLKRTRSDMRSHFALAMHGVSELEDDEYFYFL